MTKRNDLSGQTFGRLTVLRRADNGANGKTRWLCKCSCGNQTVVYEKSLKCGDTKSCGCGQGLKGAAYKPHFLRRTHNNRLYNTWSNMHYRCENPHASSYEYYGGRGIGVCEEWSNTSGFENFAEWSMNHGYNDTMEIDRIDNDTGYSPENCRWISHQSNSFNRRIRNTTGVCGITFRKSKTGVGGKWRAGIMVNGKQISLGSFQTIDEAKEARKQAEQKYFGVNKP